MRSTLHPTLVCALVVGSLVAAPAQARQPLVLTPPGPPTSACTVPRTAALVRAQEPEGPAPAPVSPEVEAWRATHRKLKFQTQLSGGLSGGFLAAGVLLMAIPERCGSCDDPGDGWLLRFFLGMALIPVSGAALISTIVYGVRLHRHNKLRPETARLRPAPGGLMLRF